MSTLITYFSGTGNSYFVADKLSENITDSKVVSITKILRDKLSFTNYSNLVIVYPIYYVGLPLIVENFLKSFNFEQFSSIYYICTSGDSDGLNCSTTKFAKFLKKYNKQLTGGFNIPLPGNYILMYDNDSQEIITNKFDNAVKNVIQIANIVTSGKDNFKSDNFGFISLLANSLWQRTVYKSDQKYQLSENCTGCGICAKVCPVNNIELINSKPNWKHHCEGCLACIHFCPEKAINTKTTYDRERYKNPKISINDLIQKK